MKTMIAVLSTVMKDRSGRANLRRLGNLLLVLLGLIVLFSLLFHVLT